MKELLEQAIEVAYDPIPIFRRALKSEAKKNTTATKGDALVFGYTKRNRQETMHTVTMSDAGKKALAKDTVDTAENEEHALPTAKRA